MVCLSKFDALSTFMPHSHSPLSVGTKIAIDSPKFQRKGFSLDLEHDIQPDSCLDHTCLTIVQPKLSMPPPRIDNKRKKRIPSLFSQVPHKFSADLLTATAFGYVIFPCIANLPLDISEASVSRNRSTIIVPAGSTRDEGWAAFRNILAEINEASRLFILPNQQNSDSSERLVGLSDDVGAGFISGLSSQAATGGDLNVERSADVVPPEEIGNLAVSKVIRVDQKRFFFDLGSNNRGHFLRISEVAGSDRSSIILPLSGLKQFHEMVGHFVEVTKDRIEGLTGANVRTVDPPQR